MTYEPGSDSPWNVTFVFRYKHFGHGDQIDKVRERLERELFLATTQPIELKVNSSVKVDLAEEETGAEVAGEDDQEDDEAEEE